jgi:hypothetical protein
VLRVEALEVILVDIPAEAPEDPEEEGGINFPLFFAESTHKTLKHPLYPNIKLTI